LKKKVWETKIRPPERKPIQLGISSSTPSIRAHFVKARVARALTEKAKGRLSRKNPRPGQGRTKKPRVGFGYRPLGGLPGRGNDEDQMIVGEEQEMRAQLDRGKSKSRREMVLGSFLDEKGAGNWGVAVAVLNESDLHPPANDGRVILVLYGEWKAVGGDSPD